MLASYTSCLGQLLALQDAHAALQQQLTQAQASSEVAAAEAQAQLSGLEVQLEGCRAAAAAQAARARDEAREREARHAGELRAQQDSCEWPGSLWPGLWLCD